jgi:hypothetical protein
MNYWVEEMKTVMERKRLIYHSPLPKKKQRTQLRWQRSGQPKVYTKEEIKNYVNQSIAAN